VSPSDEGGTAEYRGERKGQQANGSARLELLAHRCDEPRSIRRGDDSHEHQQAHKESEKSSHVQSVTPEAIVPHP
jgi:hypothetical protein